MTPPTAFSVGPPFRVTRAWPSLAKNYDTPMRVNVGQAKTDLSKLLARVEAGEEVEIARNGVPVARLVRIEPQTPGERFLASWGLMKAEGWMSDDFECTDDELDEMYGADVLGPR